MLIGHDAQEEKVKLYDLKMKGECRNCKSMEGINIKTIMEKKKQISLKQKAIKLKVIKARKLKIKVMEILNFHKNKQALPHFNKQQ